MTEKQKRQGVYVNWLAMCVYPGVLYIFYLQDEYHVKWFVMCVPRTIYVFMYTMSTMSTGSNVCTLGYKRVHVQDEYRVNWFAMCVPRGPGL